MAIANSSNILNNRHHRNGLADGGPLQLMVLAGTLE
jgi:hypothetical protein